MPITSLDGIRQSLRPPIFFSKPTGINVSAASPYVSTWAVNGWPTAGSYDTTLAGVTLSKATAGALPFQNAVSGEQYVGRFSAGVVATGEANVAEVLLVDRLWHNGGLNVTLSTAQTVNSATWPNRSAGNTSSGSLVQIGLEFSVGAATGATGATISYTNEVGTVGRTGNLIFPMANTVSNLMFPFSWQGTDAGVRSVESITLTGGTFASGTMNLVAYRVIASLPCDIQAFRTDASCLELARAQIYDDSCLAFYLRGASSGSTSLIGSLYLAGT